MNTCCVKCKKNTENVDSKMFRTKNNRFHYDDYDDYMNIMMIIINIMMVLIEYLNQ